MRLQHFDHRRLAQTPLQLRSNRLHRFHDGKVGESGRREKIFASTEAASLCIKGHGIVPDLSKKPAGVLFIFFIFIDILPAILAKRFSEDHSNGPDMNSKRGRLRVCGFPAHKGEFTDS